MWLMKSRTTIGFWGIATAFTGVLAFTTVPTPLWSLYAARDGLWSLRDRDVRRVRARRRRQRATNIAPKRLRGCFWRRISVSRCQSSASVC